MTPKQLATEFIQEKEAEGWQFNSFTDPSTQEAKKIDGSITLQTPEEGLRVVKSDWLKEQIKSWRPEQFNDIDAETVLRHLMNYVANKR